VSRLVRGGPGPASPGSLPKVTHCTASEFTAFSAPGIRQTRLRARVRKRQTVSQGRNSYEQPLSALFMAVRISSTVIWPSPLASPVSHFPISALPREMFTVVRMSPTVT